ncbi:unnamed protein product, partial [Effrenium voratum]
SVTSSFFDTGSPSSSAAGSTAGSKPASPVLTYATPAPARQGTEFLLGELPETAKKSLLRMNTSASQFVEETQRTVGKSWQVAQSYATEFAEKAVSKVKNLARQRQRRKELVCQVLVRKARWVLIPCTFPVQILSRSYELAPMDVAMDMEGLSVAEVVMTTALVVAGRATAVFFVKKCLSHTDDLYATADNVYSIFFHSYIFWLATDVSIHLRGASIDDADSAQLRLHGTTRSSNLYLWLFVIDNTVHIPLQLSKDVPFAKRATVAAHHLVSNICYLGGLWTQRMHFWGCLAGLCEITNPLLSVVFMLKELNLAQQPEGPWPRVFEGFSLLTWVSFLLFRILLLPSWILLFSLDIKLHPHVSETTTLVERVGYPLTVLAVLLMSILWMVPLTKGLVKIFHGASRAVPLRKSQ